MLAQPIKTDPANNAPINGPVWGHMNQNTLASKSDQNDIKWGSKSSGGRELNWNLSFIFFSNRTNNLKLIHNQLKLLAPRKITC